MSMQESFYGAAEELELPFTDVETDRNSGEWSKSL